MQICRFRKLRQEQLIKYGFVIWMFEDKDRHHIIY
jgi:hypothetical protein